MELLAIVNKTAHGTLRLFISKKVISRIKPEFALLGLFSIWGGCDKDCNDYFSWEYHCALEEPLTRIAGRINEKQPLVSYEAYTTTPKHCDNVFSELRHLCMAKRK